MRIQTANYQPFYPSNWNATSGSSPTRKSPTKYPSLSSGSQKLQSQVSNDRRDEYVPRPGGKLYRRNWKADSSSSLASKRPIKYPSLSNRNLELQSQSLSDPRGGYDLWPDINPYTRHWKAAAGSSTTSKRTTKYPSVFPGNEKPRSKLPNDGRGGYDVQPDGNANLRSQVSIAPGGGYDIGPDGKAYMHSSKRLGPVYVPRSYSKKK